MGDGSNFLVFFLDCSDLKVIMCFLKMGVTSYLECMGDGRASQK